MIRIALAIVMGITLAAFVVYRGEGASETGNPNSEVHSQQEFVGSQNKLIAPTVSATLPGQPTKVLNGSAWQLDTTSYSDEMADSNHADLSPTNIGPDISPEAAYPVEEKEPERLGEFIDPGDPIQYLNRTESEIIAIGEFIDPDAP